MKEINENKKRQSRGVMPKLIVLLLLLMIVSIIGYMVVMIVNRSSYSSSSNNLAGNYSFEQSIQLSEKISKIDLNFSSEKVAVIPTDDDNITVIEHHNDKIDEKNSTRIDVSGDTIRIRSGLRHNNFFVFGFNNQRYVDIYIPKKYKQNMSVQMSSGEFDIYEYELSSFSVDLSSGSAKISDMIITDESDFHLSSGYMKIQKISSKKSKLSASSGDFSVENLEVEADLDVKLTSGQVNISDVSAQSVEFESSSGSMKIKNGAFNNIDVQVTSGNVKLESSVVPETLKMRSSSGSLSVEIPDNDGFVLNYVRSSGDINSNVDLSGLSSGSKRGEAFYKDRNSSRQYSIDITSGSSTLNVR